MRSTFRSRNGRLMFRRKILLLLWAGSHSVRCQNRALLHWGEAAFHEAIVTLNPLPDFPVACAGSNIFPPTGRGAHADPSVFGQQGAQP